MKTLLHRANIGVPTEQSKALAQAHIKPDGTFFPQTFRSKESFTGTLRTMPNTLALMAVQRQTAASRSTRPLMRLQQGFVGGLPMTTLSNPSKSAQTPSFKVSIGHVPQEGGVVADDNEKKRMLNEKKRASDALEAILLKF